MSRRRNISATGRPLLGLAVTLVLFALLLVTAACQDLNSDASDTTSSVTTTTETGTGTTVTTEATAPGTESDEATEPEGGGGSDSSDSTISGVIATAHLFTTTTVDRSIGEHWTFGDDDDDQHRTIHVRDIFTVELEYPRYRQVTYTYWDRAGTATIGNHGYDITWSLLGDYITGVTYDFVASGPGECRLMIHSYHERDGDYHTWQVFLTVTE